MIIIVGLCKLIPPGKKFCRQYLPWDLSRGTYYILYPRDAGNDANITQWLESPSALFVLETSHIRRSTEIAEQRVNGSLSSIVVYLMTTIKTLILIVSEFSTGSRK